MKTKWLKIMGLALSLPSTILFLGWGTMHLAELKIITKTQGILIFLAVIVNILFTMVYYAYKRKN